MASGGDDELLQQFPTSRAEDSIGRDALLHHGGHRQDTVWKGRLIGTSLQHLDRGQDPEQIVVRIGQIRADQCRIRGHRQNHMAIGKLEEISILDEDANDTVQVVLNSFSGPRRRSRLSNKKTTPGALGSGAKRCDNLADEFMGIVAETINIGTQRIAHFEPEGLAMHEIEFQFRDP